MPQLQLYDGPAWSSLRPLTWLRAAGDVRVGLHTAAERWARLLPGAVSYLTHVHAGASYPTHVTDDNLVVAATALVHDGGFAQVALGLERGRALRHEGRLLAARLDRAATQTLLDGDGDHALLSAVRASDYRGEVSWLRRPHEVFAHNGAQLERDLAALDSGDARAELARANTVLGGHPIFLAEGAVCAASILDVREGPIALGPNSQVLPGALLRGPLAIGAHATVKMGAKVYGATSIGPHCKVGGEVQNVVFDAYSNKGHDGYLGNAVVGRWCNIGADTNASNLKNNYGSVRQWDYSAGRFAPTGSQFCGLVMGDHAKCGINTMFNTGTVVGVAANVFGAGFPRAFVPDFAWGGAGGFTTHRLDEAIATAEVMAARRGLELSQGARASLRSVFEASAAYRQWEGRGAPDPATS